ncbi:hypothetical protein L2E82_48185 [Cichorium intybus]|uniref:Uncharacterized protein n=1 Tax=Cichorium intybus TaxID=13427 RepID=A0ACB8YWS1_CICIN|nr:hypothetical protein L2E82_48185 [Cichorium intybus]
MVITGKQRLAPTDGELHCLRPYLRLCFCLFLLFFAVYVLAKLILSLQLISSLKETRELGVNLIGFRYLGFVFGSKTNQVIPISSPIIKTISATLFLLKRGIRPI